MLYSTLLLLGSHRSLLASAAVISPHSSVPSWPGQAAIYSGRSHSDGTIKKSPSCADPSWSQWQGVHGDNYCCQSEQAGVYQTTETNTVAEIRVASDQAGSATTAKLVSVEKGNAATVTMADHITTGPDTVTSATESTTTTEIQPRSTKAVFAHYMVGSMTSAQAVIDIRDAMSAGFDGFALNTHTISASDTWNIDALNFLFAAASETNFKLFISFDMSWGLNVTKLAVFLEPYVTQPSYYKFDGRPFVSTYQGGTIPNAEWDAGFVQPMNSTYGIKPFFVPNFDDFVGYPDDVFNSYPILDGVFGWESAWPAPGTSPESVTSQVDSAVLQQSYAAGKVYMMPMSPFQFKYMGTGQNWYRIGEVNLPERMAQALQLEPDFVEIITWNDAGESHYVGNFWQEQIAGSNIGNYANGFDHKGWLQVITPFINAYKAGARSISQIMPPGTKPVGALWYRPLLATAACSSSIENHQSARDAVNFAIILPSSGYTIKVYSNNTIIGIFVGQKGLNYNSVLGLAAGGGQMIQVVDSFDNIVASAIGSKSVLAQCPNASCNWNYEVMGLS